MTEKPTVVTIGTDPSPEWNQVREWVAAHYANKEVLDALKAEDDLLDETFIGLLYRWLAVHPTAAAFEIGVDENIGTIRIRLAQSAPRKQISAERLLELGVSPAVVEAATVTGQPGKPYPRFDRVMDARDRGRQRSEHPATVGGTR